MTGCFRTPTRFASPIRRFSGPLITGAHTLYAIDMAGGSEAAEGWRSKFVVGPLAQGVLIFLGWRLLFHESVRESLIYGISCGVVLGLFIPTYVRLWSWRTGLISALALGSALGAAVVLNLLLPQF